MTLFYQGRKQLCVWLVVCGVVAVMLTGSTPSATAEGSTDRTSIPSNRSALSQTSLTNTSLEYASYLQDCPTHQFSSETISIPVEAKLDSENPECEVGFEVQQAGLYNLGLRYTPAKGTGQNIRLAVRFDGASAYSDLENLSFPRLWINEKGFRKTSGDENRPTQIETYQDTFQWAQNALGLYDEPYAIYLEKGTHTISIERTAEAAMIQEITLADWKKNIPSYSDYLASFEKTDATNVVVIEAEDAVLKSDRTLAATADMTNAGMSPVSADRRLINSFGKDYWTTNGQWAMWRVPDDAQEGFYTLAFRAKQSGAVGTTTFRRLYVNGLIPFDEARCLAFPYATQWQNIQFGEESAFKLYLKPGDTITLEATTGLMAEALNTIYAAVNQLNEVYQSIIMVAGTEPDAERDYNIQKEVPTLLEDLASVREKVLSIMAQIEQVMGETNPKIFFMKRFEKILDKYQQNPNLIVPNISELKSYIDSFVGQTYDFSSLPLELDRIYLLPVAGELPPAEAGFWKTVKFEFARFVYSFTDDYASVQKHAAEDSITVWCTLGRDQAQAIKQIIDDDYVPSSGTKVDFKVSTTTLVEAILAGCEPDVSLSVTQEVPVDLALRGQALELTPYLKKTEKTFQEQFAESAWIPFTYHGGVYAIPLTQDFNMLFYRTDIFARLGLTVPENWDSFYDVLRELQKNSFQVGIRESDTTNAGVSCGTGFFETLLLQQGESYFTDDLLSVNFESAGAKNAFMQWVRLYRDYDLDTDFDLVSRFRSGEMPMLITSYGFYQNISTTAPEIAGRWTFAAMPGTLRTDGTINRTVSSTMTGTMILRSAEKRGKANAAFSFITWWASKDAQIKYSQAMQALQGVAGRPMVANRHAFESIGWSDSEKQAIGYQWNYVNAIPQVPGTYIINRSLTNALRTSYADNVDALRQLGIQTRLINEELMRKRAEFEQND